MGKTQSRAAKLFKCNAFAMTLAVLPAQIWAQSSPNTPAINTPHAILSTLTQSAWQKQTDYLTRDSQLALVSAKEQLTKRRTPESGAVELGSNRASQGGRGYEIAYTTPLWLRNERQLSVQQLRGESLGLDTKLAVSQWRVAGQVRELYWAWRAAYSDLQFANQHVENAAQLMGDVKKRLIAGDMTAADLKQTEIAHFSSLIAQSEAQNTERTALSQLIAFSSTALSPQTLLNAGAEVLPTALEASAAQHPILTFGSSQLVQLEHAKQLAIVQARARAEISVGVGRDKGASGESYQSNLKVGIKWPLGSSSQAQLVHVSMQTKLDEILAEQALETQKLASDQGVAQQRLKAAQQSSQLAQRRSDAATALLGMIQKAFSLGEFDLPTRIRAAAEANEAKRQLAKTLLEMAAAQSAYKQALGLLP